MLALLPILAVAYVAAQGRRRPALRFSSLSILREAAPPPKRLRRHAPVVLFLGAVAALSLAFSRPAVTLTVPANRITVILAIDVSRSMRLADIPASRLIAAKEAAMNFIGHQTVTSQIGVVAFSGSAQLVQAPTADPDALKNVVQGLTTDQDTAIGSAILTSLDAISQVERAAAADPSADPDPAPSGRYAPDIIVLLADSASNAGPAPLDAARQAAAHGIRVYTIGFGAAQAGPQTNGRPRSGANGLGSGVDETTLRQISAMTGGDYYTASSADDLIKVFQGLPIKVVTRQQVLDLSVLFVAAAVLLIGLAVGLSLRWQPLI